MNSSNDKNYIGQIIAVFFVQVTSSAAFAVFFSGLSLFLTEKEYYSKESATILTGLFMSFNYFLPLIGGVIVDRIISSKQLYSIGAFFSFLGCLLLAKNTNLFLGL